MSNNVNQSLIERAAEHISYWEGTGIGEYLEADLQAGDLQALKHHLDQSDRMMFEQADRPEPLTDIEMSQIASELKEGFPNVF